MQFDHRDVGPVLGRERCCDLRAHAFDLVAVDMPAYATPLIEAVQGRGREWLEAAIFAGHVPFFEGVALAVRGVHEFTLEQVGASLAEGCDGDALGWCEAAEQYREFVGLLKTMALE